MNNNMIAFQDLARIQLVRLACMDWDTNMRVPTGDGSDGDLLKHNCWMDFLVLQMPERRSALYPNSYDAFLIPEQDWTVRSGTLAGNPDIMLDSATLTDRDFTNDEPVHIFALPEDKGLTAKLVISPRLFDRFSFRVSLDNQITLWKEYIIRPPAHQLVLDILYSDPRKSKDLLGCLGYVMSFVANGYNCAEDGILEMLAHNYRRDYSRTPVFPQELIGLVDLLGIRRHLTPRDPWLQWPTESFLEFLALYAVVNSCSCFTKNQPDPVLTLTKERPRRAKQILAACLPCICSGQRYSRIMDGLIEQSRLDSGSANYASELLFLCLTGPAHPTKMKYRICDSLFSNTIACYQISRMGEVLLSPSGNDITAYIDSRFRRSCLTGEFTHFFAAAAIYAHQEMLAHCNPLEQAQQMVLHSRNKSDMVLGLYTISLVLWSQTMDQAAFRDVHFSLSPSLVSRVTGILSDPENALYHPACCAAEDLVLSGYIQPGQLDCPGIRATAMGFLAAGRNIPRARRLLSLLPFALPESVPADLSKVYLEKFETALTPDGDADELPVLFGVCANLGCWDPSQKMTAFNRMCRHLSHCKRDGETLQRLQLQGQQLFHRGLSTLETDSGLSCFDSPLESPDPKQPLETPEQTRLFLAALYHMDDPRSALEEQTFPAGITGSYLITTWFYALCRLGCAQKALDFYRAHGDILDRPASYVPAVPQAVTQHSFHSGSYVRFLGGVSRLSIGLRLSVLMGRPEVLELFLEHIPQTRSQRFAMELSLNLNRKNLNTLNQLYDHRYPLTGITPREYDALRSQVCRLDRRSRTAALRYEDFYDDRSVLLHALRTDPRSHETIFSCGYASDPEMALAAVSSQGDSLRFLRPSLRRDPALCRAALESSPSALRHIPRELLGTPEELLKLLNGRKFSLKGLPGAFTSHKELVMAAVRHNGNELRYASAQLKRDWEVVLCTIEGRTAVNPAVSLPLYYADPALLENREFILKAATVNPAAVYCASDELKEDPEIKAIAERLDSSLTS